MIQITPLMYFQVRFCYLMEGKERLLTASRKGLIGSCQSITAQAFKIMHVSKGSVSMYSEWPDVGQKRIKRKAAESRFRNTRC